MGKRTTFHKVIVFAALLISLSLIGCGSRRQPQTRESENVPKTGAMVNKYFYEEDGIALTSYGHFMYSDWEPVEFDYICMDPTCDHLNESCSARTIQTMESEHNDFSVVYRDHLIIVHAYLESVLNESSEIAEDSSIVYYMDVYEADPDGGGRSKKASFSGSIDTTSTAYAAVLADGKLYFGGPTEIRTRWLLDVENSDTPRLQTWTNDAVYCLDLNDYTLETFAVTQDREGLAYMYQFYEFDGMIYAIVSSFQEDRAVWYRIDPAAGECEEILRFESDVARFCGAIGDTVYYHYESSGKTLYARDIAEGAEEREIMTVGREDAGVSAFILDRQILFRTDYSYEGESRMTEYAVLDENGTVLDTIHYDDAIVFLDVVGDKLIYYRMGSDWWEQWWADKADLAELLERGVHIGFFNGEKQDALAD